MSAAVSLCCKPCCVTTSAQVDRTAASVITSQIVRQHGTSIPGSRSVPIVATNRTGLPALDDEEFRWLAEADGDHAIAVDAEPATSQQLLVDAGGRRTDLVAEARPSIRSTHQAGPR